MPVAYEMKPLTSLVKAMLPSLGFFGGTWADCLKLPVGGALRKIRVQRADEAADFLNLRGVLVQRGEATVSVPPGQLHIAQSSDRPESNLKPQGISALGGIHSLREVGAWWEAEVNGGVESDRVLLFNRSDGWGIRGRTLRVTVETVERGEQILYDATSPEFLRQTIEVIEHFAGERLGERSVGSVASASKWRTDAVCAVVNALRLGARTPSADEWLSIAALLPTAQGKQVGQDLGGEDWFLLAYGLCAQVARNPNSRSGVHSYSKVLNSRARLRRLEVEFDDVTQLLGVERMHHVRHGLSFRGQLREQAPEIARLVTRLREDLELVGMQPLIAYGSLLGAVREGRLLEHDDDFDMFVTLEAGTFEEFEEAKSRLYRLLEGRGWVVSPVRKYQNAHLKRGGSGVALDLFAVWLEGESAWTHMENMNWRELPRFWFEQTEEIEVDGIRALAPTHAEEFLRERYGTGWNKPDKFHDWRWPLTS